MGRLALSRREGESILIGNDITITVAYIASNQVRLLIEAPNNVAVDRREIRESKLREKGGNR